MMIIKDDASTAVVQLAVRIFMLLCDDVYSILTYILHSYHYHRYLMATWCCFVCSVHTNCVVSETSTITICNIKRTVEYSLALQEGEDRERVYTV